MRKKILPILLIVLMLIPSIPSSDADGGECLLRFSAVWPCNSFEGFAIINYGPETDLRGYTVSDGEGNVCFDESIRISTGETVAFVKGEPEQWLSFDRYYIYGQSGVRMKGFALNDSGDDVYLMRDGDVIDAFVYGSVEPKYGGWNGDSFQKISKKYIAQRLPFRDTDTADDWILTVPGRSSFGASDTVTAEVIPFVFPDSGGLPLLKELQGAKDDVNISVYLISHPDIVSILIGLIDNGVRVNILAEGSPAGGIGEEEVRALRTLTNMGADVRMMTQSDGFRRYVYLHCKYAVIDGRSVIITSENWQESSFSENRGWGAVIRSEECARYMDSVFWEDFSSDNMDIRPFADIYQTSKGRTYPHYPTIKEDFESYIAEVTMCVSPDSTLPMMKELILSGKERVYSEQLDAEFSWVHSDDNPIAWMKQSADNGADCRLCLDVTFDNPNDGDFEDGYGVIEWLEGTRISATESKFKGLTHNKGVISDDNVWVGSVNWTDNSFGQNRESAAVITSGEVADFYASYFLEDWGRTYAGETSLNIVCDREEIDSDDTFLLDASPSVTSPDARFGWDTDGDGIADREGKRIALKLPAGHHRVTLFVEDSEDVYTETLDIDVKESKPSLSVPMKYVPLIALCIIVLGLNTYHRIRKRDDVRKGDVGRRSGPRL